MSRRTESEKMSDPESLRGAEASVDDASVLDSLDFPMPKNLDTLSLPELAANLKKLDLRELLEPALYN